MSSPDFVRINGEPVRVTSLTRDGDRISLVVILRGSSANQQFNNAITQHPLLLTIPDEPEREVAVDHAEHHSSGEGERALYRHSVQLVPTSPSPPPTDDLTARLVRMEAKLDRILGALEIGTIS
jgi:hypothetical protein